MKTWLAAIILTLSSILNWACQAGAQSGRYDPYSLTFSEAQTCNAGTCARASAPTSNAEGANISSANGYRLSICAASGQTLSGAGTMQAYWCDTLTALCYRNPLNDQNVTGAVSGQRCVTWPDFQIAAITGNPDSVVFAASAVTVNGGSALTVQLYVHRERYK